MRHPTTRVLAVLELLQSHGRLSGSELAARLAVDPRTVRRYIATLEEIGIPVVAERGRDGGYALMPGFKLPPMMFNHGEALALGVGLLAARGLGLADAAPASASAAAKLERILPEALKQRMRAIGATVMLGLPQSAAALDNTALAALSEAALAQRRVHLQYRAADGSHSERAVDPYGLAFHAGCWYVVGMCHLRKEVRSFRLDRLLQATPVAERFERPAGFDVLGHLRQSVATLPRAFTVEVLLKTGLAEARSLLGDAIGVLEQAGDGVVLYNQSDDLAWFARQLASLPCDFEVRKPEQLRAELGAVAERLGRCANAG